MNGLQMLDDHYYVHFSVDDVFASFKWIKVNRPASLFDEKIFGTLRRWHNAYGLKVSLYCLSSMQEETIEEVYPGAYKDELLMASDWIKFGFHGVDSCPFNEMGAYKDCYSSFTKLIDSMGVSTSSIIRLHNWYATEEQTKFLLKNGIKVLLYPNDTNLPYIDDQFILHGLDHWKTDIQCEQNDKKCKVDQLIGKRRAVVFTHEWCLLKEIEKIGRLLNLFWKEGYQFLM